MNRTTRTIVVLCVATVTAALASIGIYLAIKSIPVREVEVATSMVTVAATTLPTGTRLQPEHLKLVKWPASSPVKGGFSSVEPLMARGLIASVTENEPITESKLAPKEAGAGLPPTIPEGMRAMSVNVDEAVGVAGFVLPGTRVDVLVTIRQGNDAQLGGAMARAVVSNLLVLTAGTRIDQEQAKDGKPIPSKVVTLAVTPADAERIALASSEGRISLALRNPLDVAPTETTGIGVQALMRGTSAPPAPVEKPAARPAPRRPVVVPVATVMPPAPAPPPAYRVETIRNAKRTEEVVE